MELPPPVSRYLGLALAAGQKPIAEAEFRQTGRLRTGITSRRWLSFRARQVVMPAIRSFVWDARVGLPLGAHLRVVDSYGEGGGAGRVSLFSIFPVASAAATPELNSGALHRFLAEAVWYATALLPQSGLAWAPVDDRTALATLTDRATTVSLEFRFNETGEVTGIYSPGRFGMFSGVYKQVPWEGRFCDYCERDGLRVPSYGEVGWLVDGELHLVWKGNLIDARYEFNQ